jgi:hypothetical protein
MNESQNNHFQNDTVMRDDSPKKRGRPAGGHNKVQREKPPKVLKKNGRPQMFFGKTDENGNPVDSNVGAYERRGKFINKILILKKNYNLSYPSRDQYVGKSNEEVIEILKTMLLEVQKYKIEQTIEQNNNFIKKLNI